MLHAGQQTYITGSRLCLLFFKTLNSFDIPFNDGGTTTGGDLSRRLLCNLGSFSTRPRRAECQLCMESTCNCYAP